MFTFTFLTKQTLADGSPFIIESHRCELIFTIISKLLTFKPTFTF